jgi:hypothetical protein
MKNGGSSLTNATNRTVNAGSMLEKRRDNSRRAETPLALSLAPGISAGYADNHRIKHHFCPTCGIAPFSEASDKSGNPMAAVNARCLEGVEISALKVMPFDGRSL